MVTSSFEPFESATFLKKAFAKNTSRATISSNDNRRAMVNNSLTLRHLIIHFPMNSGKREQVDYWVQWSAQVMQAVWKSERCEQTNAYSGARKWSKQCRASKWVSGASKSTNRQGSGSVPVSRFLVLLNQLAATGAAAVEGILRYWKFYRGAVIIRIQYWRRKFTRRRVITSLVTALCCWRLSSSFLPRHHLSF